MFSQDEFDFMPELPRRPKRPERLFLGLFPDGTAARAAEQLGRKCSQEIGLTGHLLKTDRLHTSIVHVSDRKRLRSGNIFAAELAAKIVRIPAFELAFDRMGSLSGVPKKGRPLEHPLVLLAQDGPVRSCMQRSLRD